MEAVQWNRSRSDLAWTCRRERDSVERIDLNGNGETDSAEEYLDFRIWEEMTGNREEDEETPEEE